MAKKEIQNELNEVNASKTLNSGSTVAQEEMSEGLTFKDILFIIRKHLLMIFICLGVGFGGGVVYNAVQPTEYNAQAMLIVKPGDTWSNQSGTAQFSLVDSVAQTYVELATSNVVLTKASEELKNTYNIERSVGALKSGLSVERTEGNLPITFSYKETGDDAKKNCIIIVNTCANELISYINTPADDDPTAFKYGPIVGGNLTVGNELDPNVNDASTVSHFLTRALIATAIGLVVAVGYIVIYELLDNRFKSNDEIERLLALPVLSGIPMYGVEDFPSEVEEETSLSSEEVR